MTWRAGAASLQPRISQISQIQHMGFVRIKEVRQFAVTAAGAKQLLCKKTNKRNTIGSSVLHMDSQLCLLSVLTCTMGFCQLKI